MVWICPSEWCSWNFALQEWILLLYGRSSAALVLVIILCYSKSFTAAHWPKNGKFCLLNYHAKVNGGGMGMIWELNLQLFVVECERSSLTFEEPRECYPLIIHSVYSLFATAGGQHGCRHAEFLYWSSSGRGVLRNYSDMILTKIETLCCKSLEFLKMEWVESYVKYSVGSLTEHEIKSCGSSSFWNKAKQW